MLSFRVLVATHPRQPANFFPGLTATLFPIPELRSLPHFREFAHKSFSCNTYEYPRKCCKQKTYSMGKPFRCSTYKKQGGHPSCVSTFPLRAPCSPSLLLPYSLPYSLPYFPTSTPPSTSSCCAVDRRAKAGDNFMSTSTTGVAAISEEGE